MRVVCIKTGKIKNLTEGKSYQLIKVSKGIHLDSNIEYKNFVVVNDAGIERMYSASRFITLEEFRNKKLVELGI